MHQLAKLLYLRRKVLPDTDRPAWWDQFGKIHTFFLDLECGHTVMRRCANRPKFVYCEKCPRPDEPVPPCPTCGSDELCYPDCPVALWNQEE